MTTTYITSREAWHCEKEASLHKEAHIISYHSVVNGRPHPITRWWLVWTCEDCHEVWWEEDHPRVIDDAKATS